MYSNADFKFWQFAFSDILHTLYGPSQMPIRSKFPGFYGTVCCSHSKCKIGVFQYLLWNLINQTIIGISQWLNPSGHTGALGSTQPLTEMSTRDVFWG
jgi:hypothetical protein